MLEVSALGWTMTILVILGLLALDLMLRHAQTARGRFRGGGRLVGVLHRRRASCSGSCSRSI